MSFRGNKHVASERWIFREEGYCGFVFVEDFVFILAGDYRR